MENNQKPEWFQLADNDQPAARPLKKKSAPMRGLTFVLAGALVIPMGAGLALLAHEDHSAFAAGALNLVQDSPAATSPTQALPINTISMPTASREDDYEDDDDDDYRAPVIANSASGSPTISTSAAPAITTKTPGAKAPVAITPPGSASNEIILPPSKKAGDDDDDEDDDDDDHDNKKSNGKKSKDSDDDDDEDDEEDDD